MMCSTGSGMAGGLLLIALALGYLVLIKARLENVPFRFLGYLIAVVIIVASGELIIEKAAARTAQKQVYGGSSMMCKGGKMGMMKGNMPMRHQR